LTTGRGPGPGVPGQQPLG